MHVSISSLGGSTKLKHLILSAKVINLAKRNPNKLDTLNDNIDIEIHFSTSNNEKNNIIKI